MLFPAGGNMLSSFGSFLEMYDINDKPCAAVKIGKTLNL